MTPPPTFGLWVKQLRTALDLTQEVAAERVGCAVHTLRAIERGARRPSLQVARRLAEVLALPPAELDRFLRLARGDAPPDDPPAPPPALPAAPPPGPPLAALPLAAGPLIGRERELAEIQGRLGDPACRLLTLLGPGGVGKTRLALQVATGLAAQGAFPDGVRWVNLAPVADPGHLAAAVAAAVGVIPQGGGPLDDILIAQLQGRRMLLALDNMEHLLEATPLLARMLQDAPGLTALVTSRERLRAAGEWVVALGGLPDAEGEGMPAAPATLLFIDRARRIDQGFTLSGENAAAVRQICRLLEGMPLGIELAASWLKVLTCQEIVDEIGRSLDFLAADWRDAEPRHRSLRAVFEQSWRLLAPAERGVLAGMAVFRGGGTREAIAAVTSPPGPLLPILAALVDKSLVRTARAPDGTTRYELHELVRQYAAEQLAGLPGGEEAARRRHAATVADFVARKEHELRGPRLKEARAEFRAEIDNIRAAWHWACAAGDSATVLKMIHAVGWFYALSGLNHEALGFYQSIVAHFRPLIASGAAPREAELVYWYGWAMDGWYAAHSQPQRALELMGQAAEALRRLGDPKKIFHTVIGLAHIYAYAGDRARSEAALDEAEAAAAAAAYPWGVVQTSLVRLVAAVEQNDVAAAERILGQSLAAARRVGDPHQLSMHLLYAGLIATQEGRLAAAEEAYAEALAMADATENRVAGQSARLGLAEAAGLRGDTAAARALWAECLAEARELRDRWREARALSGLGSLLAAAGEADEAGRLLRAGLEAAAGAPPAVALDALAALADFELGSPGPAAPATLAYLRRHPLTRPATRRRAEERWAALAPADREAAEARAAPLPLDQPAALLSLFT